MLRANHHPEPSREPDAGSASVEFLLVGLGLLLPLVYLVFVLGAVQSGALAVEGAARGAARAAAQAPSLSASRTAATGVVVLGLADVGLHASDATVVVRCSPDPAACLTPGSRVTVTVAVIVPLPLLPHVFGLGRVTDIPVTATATAPVSRFAGESP